MANITKPTSFSQIPKEKVPEYLDKFAQDVTQKVNGQLDFSNMNVQIISVNFSTANVSQAFSHTLGRVPKGYIPHGQSFNGNIYNGTNGSTASTIYLRSSAVGTANILLY
jgi:hypothetical protein